MRQFIIRFWPIFFHTFCVFSEVPFKGSTYFGVFCFIQLSPLVISTADICTAEQQTRFRGEEGSFLVQYVFQFAEWAVIVQNIKSTAKGAQYQIVFTLLNGNVAHRDRG